MSKSMLGAALLAALAESAEQAEAEKPELDAAGKIDLLKAYVADYGKNPFKVGDLVTPRATSNIKWRGEPFLVVESWPDDSQRNWNGAPSDMEYGSLSNIRTARVTEKGNIVLFWNAAHDFEPWIEPKKQPSASP